MALLNTSEKKIQAQVFELEERLKRIACRKGCFVVSLLEMCRNQASNLMKQSKYDPDEGLAKGEIKASASIAGKSFDEAIMQNELYRQHELGTGFNEDRIRKAENAFAEAVNILKKA